MRYMLVTYVTKPGGQIDEVIELSKKIRQKDQQLCNVILDYTDKKVIKCIVAGNNVDKDWDKLDGYYRGIYPAVLERLEKEAAIYKKIKA
tara:strand:+ start:3553 stop:3822 length:270 start_codon:yes stop_codon:yes gene_type:complete